MDCENSLLFSFWICICIVEWNLNPLISCWILNSWKLHPSFFYSENFWCSILVHFSFEKLNFYWKILVHGDSAFVDSSKIYCLITLQKEKIYHTYERRVFYISLPGYYWGFTHAFAWVLQLQRTWDYLLFSVLEQFSVQPMFQAKNT